MPPIKIIAFNLPQFHPIPENDKWWGAGFTEWRNVAKARPLFPGHRQPNLPGELGFYDMRLDETQEQQGELAAWAGIDAFCYYHYWFAGRLLLEQPLERLLNRDTPKLPFCLCWANHSWTNHWVGISSNDILVEQTYPGIEDHRSHYEYLRRFFEDDRYLRVDGKPVFVIFHPNPIPEIAKYVELYKRWAHEDGFGGLFMIGLNYSSSLVSAGFDALTPYSLSGATASYLNGSHRYFQAFRRAIARYPRCVIDYGKFNLLLENNRCDGLTTLPTAVPNWDNTPRMGRRGLVLANSTPDKFATHLRRSVEGFNRADGVRDRILFIKSWNEWAEGNYLEPDMIYGRGWLEAVRNFVQERRNIK